MKHHRSINELFVYVVVATIVSVIVLFASPAKAGSFQTGNTLYERCTSNENISMAFCYGYVQGSLDMLDGTAACMPPNFTAQQGRDMILKLLREEPQLRSELADVLIFQLFKRVYPCPAKNNPSRAPLT